MKKLKLTLTIFAIFFATLTYSQSYFSVENRTFAYWNSVKSKFIKYGEDNQKSLFKLNDDETLFTHITESLTSTYYITKRGFEEDKYIWTYDVISDVGNKYTFVFDPKNNQIRSLASVIEKNDVGEDIEMLIMTVYYVKRSFTDSDKTNKTNNTSNNSNGLEL